MPRTLAVLAFIPLFIAAEPAPPPHVVRFDADGVRLPPGAIARLGSTRFRHEFPVEHVAYSPDGRHLATACLGSVTVWDARTGRRVWAAGREWFHYRRVAYAADGKALHAAGGTREPKEWEVVAFDAATGKHIGPFRGEFKREDPEAALDPPARSPDGRTAARPVGNTVVLRDWDTDRRLPQSANPDGHVEGMMFSTDGRQLLARDDRYWRSWDVAHLDPAGRPGPTHETTGLSPDERLGFRLEHDKPLLFIDPTTGRRPQPADPPEIAFGREWAVSADCWRFSADGKRVVGPRFLGPSTRRVPARSLEVIGVGVWEATTGKRVGSLPGGWMDVRPLAVSPDGRAVVVWLDWPGVSSAIGLWEPDTNAARWTWGGRYLHRDCFVTFAAGGSQVIVQKAAYLPYVGGCYAFPIIFAPPGPFVVLDAKTGKTLRTVKGPPLDPPPRSDLNRYTGSYVSAVSPDGRTAATTGYDNTLYLWDLIRDVEITRFAHPGPVHELVFTPDGRRVVAASAAGPLLVYDVPSR